MLVSHVLIPGMAGKLVGGVTVKDAVGNTVKL
jgi:hypothetical protein